MKKFRALPSPKATVVLTDDKLEVSSGAARTSIPWSQFAAVLDSPDFLVLRLKRGSSLTIPTAGVDGAITQFIRGSVGSK